MAETEKKPRKRLIKIVRGRSNNEKNKNITVLDCQKIKLEKLINKFEGNKE